jgi:hypothetical protein
VLAGILMLAVGCQSVEREQNTDSEALLKQAGFDVRYAQTPKDLQRVKALPQRSLVNKQKDGKAYFVYADATGCKCMYFGNAAEYEAYRKLEDQQELAASERLHHVIENANAEMYYDTWIGDDALPEEAPPPGTFPGV